MCAHNCAQFVRFEKAGIRASRWHSREDIETLSASPGE